MSQGPETIHFPFFLEFSYLAALLSHSDQKAAVREFEHTGG